MRMQYGSSVQSNASTVTAAGTTTLVNTSPQIQNFTGSSTQIVVLPDATTMAKGMSFEIYNSSTGAVTINKNGGAQVTIVGGSTSYTVKLIDNSTAAGTWVAQASAGGLSLWTAGYSYSSDKVIIYSKNIFICVTAHTSTSSFETDLLSGYWQLMNEQPTTKNYFRFQNFEDNDVSGWTLGTVTLDGTTKFPNAAPTFGSGASGNLSLGIVTGGAQLSQTYSLSLVSSAATTAGNFMASPVLKIDKEDFAKVLQFKFSYLPASGTANAVWAGNTTNSFGIAIYDIDNATWIQPSGCFSMNSGSATLCGEGLGEFQTSATGTQYRLVVYNANATSGAITNYFDSFVLGKQGKSYGSPVTDWVSYTLAIKGATTDPTEGTGVTKAARWRRVGDSMEIEFQYKQTGAGTAGSGGYYFPLPTGYSIDTSKMTISDSNALVVGNSRADNGATYIYGVSVVYNSTAIFIQGGNDTQPFNTIGASFFQLSGTTIRYAFTARVPIQGWSSSVVMSSDANTNVVATRVYKNGTQTFSAETKVTGWTIESDRNGMWDATNNRFNILVPGDYEYKCNINAAPTTTATQVSTYRINGGGSYFIGTDSNNGAGGRFGGSALIPNLKAGDYIEIYHYTSAATTIAAGSTGTNASLTKISGTAQIASSTIVAVNAVKSGNKTIPGTATQTAIDAWTVNTDTTGSFNSTTGVFSAPTAGLYNFSTSSYYSMGATATGQLNLNWYKNISTRLNYHEQTNGVANKSYAETISAMSINLLQGETVTLYGYSSNQAVTYGGSFSYLYISKVGGLY